ncbi:MAG: hypothetical protein JXA82_09345 [Sedimentisphaerales bacterium]|nr:hypothetical protein [Sedimentisphaerales bacterium]
MNAEQVVDKILAEANGQAETIRSEAHGKADEGASRLQTELDAFEKETLRLAKEAAEDKKARMLAAARMDNRKQYLFVQVELLDEIFEKAIDRINSLPEEDYQALMAALMANAVETGDEQILVGKKEMRINDRVIKTVNRQLGPGFKGNLQLASERTDIRGGFILRRGNIRINVSTEVLVGQIRQELETELAQMLFGDEQGQE